MNDFSIWRTSMEEEEEEESGAVDRKDKTVRLRAGERKTTD